MDIKNKNTTIIVMIVLGLMMIGFLWYSTMPKDLPKSEVVVVPADILNQEGTTTIEKRPIFGNVPVSVNSEEKSREDPFANL